MTASTPPRRILVIDDNKAIHEDFVKILAAPADRAGHDSKAELDELEAGLFDKPVAATLALAITVDSAFQGQDGLKLIAQARQEGRPYAMAFVDMRMPPGWDGLETSMRILQEDPFIQIVICTAYSDYSWSEMTEKLGTNDRVLILKKPFDNIEVLQLVQSLGEKWELVREAHARRETLERLVLARTKELDSTNARLKAIIEASPMGIIASDPEGKVTTWNPAAQRTFGWSIDEIVNRDRLDAMPDDLRSELDRLIQGWLASSGSNSFELHVRCKDGSEIDVSLSTAVLRDALGHVDGLITIVNDITTRKKIEMELRRAKIAAEATTQAKSDFLANMSHEIRTPMNGVIGMTDLLLDTELSPEQREFAGTVRSCGEALLTLINDILDFSKIEAGKLDMENIPFSPRVMIEETVAMLAQRAQAKKLDLCCLVSAEMPNHLLGDPTRLRQVLLNLLSNAIKFTERGEISISSHVVTGSGGQVVLHLAVRDTGIGLSDEAKTRLFQQFSQADNSVTRKYGGTGLGLAISKRLIELMGGTIAVDSTVGRGSVFTCVVPLGCAEEPQQIPLTIDLSGRRALCIDGSVTSRRALREQLTAWGITCEEANDEVSALLALATKPTLPDLIIIDGHLPGMEGIDLARVLKARMAPATRPMVLLTAIAHRGMAAAASEAGIAGFLTKPVRQGQLYDCLLTVLHMSIKKLPAVLVTRHTIAEARAASRRRALVVEDNAINQRIITMQLTKLGCQVDVVGNGIEALAATARTDYDIVFMDCAMPEMDGFAATTAIRRSEDPDRHSMIIALTASALEEDRDRCLKAGMDDFVSKPTSLEILKKIIDRLDQTMGASMDSRAGLGSRAGKE